MHSTNEIGNAAFSQCESPIFGKSYSAKDVNETFNYLQLIENNKHQFLALN